jgi:hypothetical protein
LSEEGRVVPLRATLVWTDPPGNPAAGAKLVNDLDLIVTNLDTGEFYYGNDIPAGQDWACRISDAIHHADALVALLSKEWFSSGVCRDEFRMARDARARLLPVQLSPVAWERDPGLQRLEVLSAPGEKPWVAQHRRGPARDLAWTHIVCGI